MNWTEDSKIRTWLPKVQAHRGYWFEGERQNSLASIQAAFSRRYEMVEFDVRLTKDLEVVLFHDESFQAERIKNITLERLRTLTPITKLEDVFEWLKEQNQTKLKLNVELKTAAIFKFTLEKKVLALVKKYDLINQIIISSFNPFSLARIRWFEPTIYRALIQTLEKYSLNRWFIRSRIFNFLCAPHAFHLRYLDWNDRKMQKIAAKVPIVLWTVNEINLYFQLATKVHGIISDQITPQELETKI